MARGWESKSIESQQEEASRQPRQPTLSDEQRARAAERRTLELTRTRTLADLERASSPAHKRMLEQAIAALDQQLSSLPD
jgi:hypothetical protein